MSVFSSIIEGVVPIEDLKSEREKAEKTVYINSGYIETDTCIFSNSFERFSQKCGLDVNKLTENLPYITVTGYYQSTLIQKFTNLMDYFLMGKSKAADDTTTATKSSASEAATFIGDIFRGLRTASGWEDLLNPIAANAHGIDGDKFIEKVPYVLMLSLMNTQKFATFKLPISGEFELMGSDSGYGWGQPIQLNPQIQANSVGGAIGSTVGLGGILRSLGVFLSPVFTAGQGTGENPSMTINIDLINDRADKAETNTNFLKSLTVKNMWMQYGIWQLPGALYDVVVGKPGGGKYLRAQFMCTANFKVTPKGAFRKCDGIDFPVPEAYNFVATFKSLLPNNLNTHLFAKYDSAFNNRKGLETTVFGRAADAVALRGAQARLTDAEAEKAKAEDDLTKARQNQEAITNEITKLKNDLAQEKSKNDSNPSPDTQTKIDTIEARITAAQGRSSEAETAVETARQRATEATTEVESIRQRIQRYTTNVDRH